MWRTLAALLNDATAETWEFIAGFGLNILFLGLSALLLWPLDREMLALRLAKGYVLLWVSVWLTARTVNFVQTKFRVDLYKHPDAYVISNLFASGFLVLGWSAFAALTVHSLIAGTSSWGAAALYLFGFLSSVVAWMVVGSFYQGHVYKLVNLPLALVSFIMFVVWPKGGRALYGWFFDLF